MFRLPADAVEPEFAALYDYWRGKCREGRLPARRDIDPLDLPRSMLPNILLLDVERGAGAPRFRVRLAGTGFAALLGREFTGRYFDEVGPAHQMAPVLDALATLVATRRPAFLAGPMVRPNRDHVWLKRFALPLAEDGETVDMILASFRWLAHGSPPAGAAAAE